MPPIHMSMRERALLSRLARAPMEAAEIRREATEKFINHGLAVKQAMFVKITTRGQLEVLRQRFRRMPPTETGLIHDYDFLSKFENPLKSGLLRGWRDKGELRNGTR